VVVHASLISNHLLTSIVPYLSAHGWDISLVAMLVIRKVLEISLVEILSWLEIMMRPWKEILRRSKLTSSCADCLLFAKEDLTFLDSI